MLKVLLERDFWFGKERNEGEEKVKGDWKIEFGEKDDGWIKGVLDGLEIGICGKFFFYELEKEFL